MEELQRVPTLLLEDDGVVEGLGGGDPFVTPRGPPDGEFGYAMPETPCKELLSPPARRIGSDREYPGTTAAKGRRESEGGGSPLKKRPAVRRLMSEDPLVLVTQDSFVSAASSIQPDPLSHYHATFTPVRDLGIGSFGSVVLVRHNYDGNEYAVKISRRPLAGRQDQKNKLREAQMLALCVGCPFIVRYHNVWIEERQVFLQMEACKLGSVAAHLAASGHERWCDKRLGCLVVQIGLALRHLHDLRIVHLDVKPDNILMAARDVFKLGDFSVAGRVPKQQPPVLSQELSQASFSSLQEGDGRFIPCDMMNDKTFPMEADIFSFGLTVFEVAAGVSTPASGTPEWHAVRRHGISAGPLADRDCSYLSTFLSALTNPEPTLRPTAPALLSSFCSIWAAQPELPTPLSPLSSCSQDPCFTASEPCDNWTHFQKLLLTRQPPSQ